MVSGALAEVLSFPTSCVVFGEVIMAEVQCWSGKLKQYWFLVTAHI
jgi:hypothetical protein